MISILIPIYNYDVTLLVGELQDQIDNLEVEVEIICYDDGSNENFLEINEAIAMLSKVTYVKMPSNLGRSKIRNKLASNANGEYLLFLDCDVSLPSSGFISRYAQAIGENAVVVGGIVYAQTEPKDKLKLLRWKYGREREQSSSTARSKAPYQSFLSANFLISKEMFMSIQFDESIVQYGYEDILLGIRLKEIKEGILHIDNPVQHDGLDSSEGFIEKSKISVQTLATLIKEKKLLGGVRLFQAYRLLKRFGTQRLFLIYYRKNTDNWIANLKSDNPNIRNLDLLKLGRLIEEMEVN